VRNKIIRENGEVTEIVKTAAPTLIVKSESQVCYCQLCSFVERDSSTIPKLDVIKECHHPERAHQVLGR
jgi:hypothetical protein